MSERLNEYHAILTGAGGGIGTAVVQAFLEEGARCTAMDITAEASPELQQLLQRFPESLRFVQADVTRTNQLGALVDAACQTFGPVTTLFNNAAIFDMAPLLDTDEAMFDRLFDVNVRGMFFMMQTVLQKMVNDAGAMQGRGAVINMSSQAGRRGESKVSHYCASKAAVISYTQSAALAMAEHGIRVNAIAPGVVDTPMWETVDALYAKVDGLAIGQKKAAVGKAVPLGRMGVPGDISGVAVFLASDEARYVTGQTLNVDGGNVLS